MSTRQQIMQSKERLQRALANGQHCRARESYLELLQASRAWLQEVQQQSVSVPEPPRSRQLTENLESIGAMLDRNEQLVRIDAPFLLGEHVEIERVEFGLRFVWVPGSIVDFRLAAIRARQLRNPRALDYLVHEEDGEERWRADEGIRKRRE